MYIYIYLYFYVYIYIYVWMELWGSCSAAVAVWRDGAMSPTLECFLPFDLLLSSAANSQRCVEAATPFILMRIRCSLLLRRPFSVYIIPNAPKTLTLKAFFPFILYHTPPKKKTLS